MYKVYIYEGGYLKLVKRNVTEEELEQYGDIEDKIYDGYIEDNPNHIGYKIVKEVKKSFKDSNVFHYAFKEVS